MKGIPREVIKELIQSEECKSTGDIMEAMHTDAPKLTTQSTKAMISLNCIDHAVVRHIGTQWSIQ